MLNLYFLYMDEVDDEGSIHDHDLLVRAKSAKDAVEMWRKHFIDRDSEFVDEMTDPDGCILVNPFAPEGVLHWGKAHAQHVSYKGKPVALSEPW